MKAPIDDRYWMASALILAAEGVGLTRPNPPVGAVVVKKGKMIGAGYHPAAGKPHAEVYALGDAGSAARGATLYVTLEPCSTAGRTPPCTDAIISAGISRVVYGCDDPNPSHAGRSARILRRKGVKVTRNILERPCRELIAPFSKFITEGRPYVTVKLGCSLDGRIADRSGTSRWITGKEARDRVQDLRRCADAIMVGAETVRADNPSLIPRPAWGRKPVRAVVAGDGALPRNAKMFHDVHADRTVVYRGQGLKAVLRDLAGRDCMHVLCEGGGKLAGSLVGQGLVDELKIFYAPIILGDAGRPAFAGNWRLDKAPGFVRTDVEAIGNDVLVTWKKNPQL